MPTKAVWIHLLSLFFCLANLAACQQRTKNENPTPPLTSAGTVTRGGVEFFDRLVTTELVFPDMNEGARYLRRDPENKDNQRTYSYELKPQLGMEQNRHFHIISIAVTRGGLFLDKPANGPKRTSTAGPHGAFSDVSVQTDDRAYDVRVSEGMLLPEGVAVPKFDMNRVAEKIVRQYRQLKGAPEKKRSR